MAFMDSTEAKPPSIFLILGHIPGAPSISIIPTSLGLQISQSRPYLHTSGPKVGIIYIHGALGLWALKYIKVTYFVLFGAPESEGWS